MSEKKRNIYLIDPKFQVKFALLLGVFILLSNAFFSYIVYNYFMHLLSFVEPDSVSGFDIEREERRVVVMLSSALVLYALLAALGGFFFSHRIAGPLYKLKKFLGEVRKGGSADKVTFRKGDYFPEVAEEVSRTVAWLKGRSEGPHTETEESSGGGTPGKPSPF